MSSQIPFLLSMVDYDGIILHYTFLAGARFLENPTKWNKRIARIKSLKGFKVAIPQDEYDETDRLCDLFKNHDIKTVFSCFDRYEDFIYAYPEEKAGKLNYVPVFTGYVEESEKLSLAERSLPYVDRPCDIGYRARKLPYFLGKHGQLKYELAEFFKRKLKNSNFIYDIANNTDNSNVFLGKDWYGFLLNCKAFLGCEGGSSLLDADGSIKRCLSKYMKKHPEATFEEAEKVCFPGQDFNIKCFAVSPRHFEAIMTKTLQVLVEGNYGGILKPEVHYIELKRDFSNIKDVLDKLQDSEYCQQIIDRAYQDVIESGRYTYSKFANLVVEHIRINTTESKTHYYFNDILFYLVGFYIFLYKIIFGAIVYILAYLYRLKNFLFQLKHVLLKYDFFWRLRNIITGKNYQREIKQ